MNKMTSLLSNHNQMNSEQKLISALTCLVLWKQCMGVV
jgi:hypothetical protein